MAEQVEEKNESDSGQSETYAFVDNDALDTNQAEIGIPKRTKKKNKKGKQNKEKKIINQKSNETKQQPPSIIAPKSTFAQIAKELKAKRLEQLAYAAAMAKKKKKNRVLRDEELYTDKDRAAAVNLGTRDIKQSLKQKKKDDKNYDPQMSEEADPSTLLVLGNNELRNGDLKIALNFMNKALELSPDDKNGLVARSKCYLLLGDPKLALQDAETVLQSDKTFVRAIYQKAEALYHLGDFEHSLMYYHQGHRLRPELEIFRLGVQKAQEAIENIIGTTPGPKKISSRPSSPKRGTCKNEKPASAKSSKEVAIKQSASSRTSSNRTTNRGSNKSAEPNSRRLLGELGVDRLYLEGLIKNPDLNSTNQEAVNIIKAQAEEGINFLKNRQEFWRQQKPNNIAGK